MQVKWSVPNYVLWQPVPQKIMRANGKTILIINIYICICHDCLKNDLKVCLFLHVYHFFLSFAIHCDKSNICTPVFRIMPIQVL